MSSNSCDSLGLCGGVFICCLLPAFSSFCCLRLLWQLRTHIQFEKYKKKGAMSSSDLRSFEHCLSWDFILILKCQEKTQINFLQLILLSQRALKCRDMWRQSSLHAGLNILCNMKRQLTLLMTTVTNERLTAVINTHYYTL